MLGNDRVQIDWKELIECKYTIDFYQFARGYATKWAAG